MQIAISYGFRAYETVDGNLARKETVDNFVAAKAPDFSAFQQGLARMRQTVQFKASNFHAFSANFNKLLNLVRDQEVGGSNPLAPMIQPVSDNFRNGLLIFRAEIFLAISFDDEDTVGFTPPDLPIKTTSGQSSEA